MNTCTTILSEVLSFLEIGNLTSENLKDMLLEDTEQWNLVSGLVRVIMSRKSIESIQGYHGLDSDQGNE